MGLLIDGVWHDNWYDTGKTGGRFVRSESVFRNWITPDGAPGPSGDGGCEAEPRRYHLYVSLACPWAHRTLIFRAIKRLEGMISVDVVSPDMLSQGWVFDDSYPGATRDTVNGAKRLYENYLKAKPDYTGRVTVPTLWDKKRETIVSNESADIIRMFNSAFDQLGAAEGDYYPADLREEIDAINERVYHTVNNGVYKCGFSTTQKAYEENFSPLFDTLDHIEARLSRQRYLVGDRLTEADWRLFTTLVRFDAVYYSHFKCNLRRVADYPNIWGYVRELYQMPGVEATVSLDHIKRHYYGSHETINPTRIVPVGPEIDFNAPHRRDHLPKASPLPVSA